MLWGAVLCLVGCLATFLAYPHWTSVALPLPIPTGTTKMTPDIAKCPPRGKVTPGREPLFKKNRAELSNQVCIMQVSQSAYGLHLPMFLTLLYF